MLIEAVAGGREPYGVAGALPQLLPRGGCNEWKAEAYEGMSWYVNVASYPAFPRTQKPMPIGLIYVHVHYGNAHPLIYSQYITVPQCNRY